MSIWSAIGSAVAGNVVSGLFGNERNEDNLHAAEQQQAQNIALQREFAQNGIRWRVEDAKAAGLHPVFALGGGGAAFANNPVVVGSDRTGWEDFGQNLSRAVAAQETPDQRMDRALQRGLVLAQTRRYDEEANLFAAQASRMVGDPGPGLPSSAGNPVVVPESQIPSMPPAVEYQPAPVTAHTAGDRTTTAGSNPPIQRFNITKDGSIQLELPSERLAEAWEDMPILGQVAFGAMNLPNFGRWLAHKAGDLSDRVRDDLGERDRYVKWARQLNKKGYGVPHYLHQVHEVNVPWADRPWNRGATRFSR